MSKAHFFVIVQTQEGGDPVLSIVPNQWVLGDILMWPNKNAASLSKDASSKPTASWTKIPCVVKRKYIPTYKDAEKEAADLSGLSTDTSEYAQRKKQRKNPTNEPAKGYDFNHMLTNQAGPSVAIQSQLFENQGVNKINRIIQTPTILSQPVIAKPVLRPTQQSSDRNPAQLKPMKIVNTVVPSTSTTPDAPLIAVTQTNKNILNQVPNVQLVDQSQVSLLSDADIIALLQNSQGMGLDSQTALNQSQGENVYHKEFVTNVGQPSTDSQENRIIHAISRKIEPERNLIVAAVTSRIEASLIKTVAAMKSDFDIKMEAVLRVRDQHGYLTEQSFEFSPAATIEQIKQVENDLADKSYQDIFINHMRKIIGPNGNTCNGQNMCYVLVDCFFNRNVKLECSWSGGSKSDMPKYAIKDFFKCLQK